MGGKDAQEFRKALGDGKISLGVFSGAVPLAPLGLYSDIKAQISNK